jgi:chromosome segregation ATPase
MSDEGEHFGTGDQSNPGKWILFLLAILFAVGTAYGYFSLHARVAKLSGDLDASQTQVAELKNRMQNAEASEAAIDQRLGITKKELAERTAQLQAEQRMAEARVKKQQEEEISRVSGDVASVKTDVGGVKSDVASTKADLEATKAKLQSTIGDLGVQSGLIARTRDDLETLKHKGDRNYYEFTLIKGAKPQAVSTVSLQLKKTDAKRGKFTMNVTSDDRTIEKKDRTMAEPIQFYSGREHSLFELVVWTVDKNKVTGYLSAPKNAPVPVTTAN